MTGPKKKVKKVSPAKGLLDAIKFVKPCTIKKGAEHCMIQGGWLAASNEVITMGSKIEEDLTAYPHIKTFEAALKKVEEDLAITQLSDELITITSGDFKAIIDCVPEIEISSPDQNIAPVNNRILKACQVLSPILDPSGSDIRCSSALLKKNSAVATEKHVLVEYWHGIDLPEMLVPKEAVDALAKVRGKELVGFGYSGPTCTFWFEDESFISTRLYDERYPEWESFLECDNPVLWDVPEDFSKAVRMINQFSKSGFLYFKSGKICSEDCEPDSSTYSIDQLPEGMIFNSKYLLKVDKVFKKVYFDERKKRAFFFDDNLRGIISGMKMDK